MSSNGGGSNGAEQLFTIEQIVKRKVEYDDVTYRIKWKDWNDKTWEPRDTLADTAESAVLDFERDYFQKGVQKIGEDEQRLEEEKRKAAELVVKREREEKLKKMMTGSLIPSSFAFNRKRKLEGDDELKSSSTPSTSTSTSASTSAAGGAPTPSQNGDASKCADTDTDTTTSTSNANASASATSSSEDSSLPAQKRARTDSGASVDSSTSSSASASAAVACGALSSKLDKSMGASRTPNSEDTHVFKKRPRPSENDSGVTSMKTDDDDPVTEEKSSSADESAKDVSLKLKEESGGSTVKVMKDDPSPPQPQSASPPSVGEEDGVGLECPLPKSRKLERGQSPNAVKKEEALKVEALKDEDGDSKTKGNDPPSSSEGTQSATKTEETEEMPKPTTGLFFDRKCLFHFGGSDEPECPERYEACVDLLLSKGIDKRCCLVKPGLASDDDLRRVHDEKLLEELNTINERLVEQANDSRVITDMSESYYENEYTLECVRRSVAASIDMTKRVYDGELDNGFCLIRPPGHHCDRSKRFGFCHANNVAIAAKYLMKERRARRVAILDWDVHHGNGTQDIFHDEKEVLFISIHQEYADENDKMFPATGEVSDIGDRSARGYTMNLPIPCGCGDSEYKAMLDDVIMPALEEFDPEILLISAGFDSADGDPLGSLELKPEMFAHMTRLLMDRLNGKVVMFLEGGYNPKVVAKCVVHCMYALLGDDLPYVPTRSEEYDFIFHHLDKFVLTHRKYWLRIDQNNLPSEALKRPSKKSKTKKRWQLYRRRHKHKKLMRQRERERERAERREKRMKKHQSSSQGGTSSSEKEKEKSERKSVELSDSDDEAEGSGEKAVGGKSAEKDQKARDLAKQKKRERHEQRRREKEERQKEREKRKHKKKKRKHTSDDEAYAVNDDISQYHKKKKRMSVGSNGVVKSNASGDIPPNTSGGGGGNLVVKSGGVPRKRGRPRKDSLNGASSGAGANIHAAAAAGTTKNGTSSASAAASTSSSLATNGEKSSSAAAASQNNASNSSRSTGGDSSSNDTSHVASAAAAAAMTDDVTMARPHHVLLVE